MTTIALPLESSKMGDNFDDQSNSENGTDKIQINLPNTSEVSSPSQGSLGNSETVNDNIIKEISVSDKVNSEDDENKSKNLIDQSAQNVIIETSSFQNQSQEKVTDGANDSKIHKKNKKIFDSDEDDDEDTFASLKLKKSSKPSAKKPLAIVDSDSEDDNIFTLNQRNNEETASISEMSENQDLNTEFKKKKSRISNILDSDSEDESTNIFDNIKEKTSNFKQSAIVDSDSKDKNSTEESSEDENDESRERKKKSSLQLKKVSNNIRDLVDSDDSEPDERHVINRELSDVNDEYKDGEKGKKKTEKRRKGSARASKDAAMLEIHSESQRLIRESNVSLPYHRPKQRTLQEFLNRKKISSLPEAPTTAAKVKMFDDLILKAVEEKEKEAEIFYKSSDSEDEVQLSNVDNGIEQSQISTQTQETVKRVSTDTDTAFKSSTEVIDAITDSKNIGENENQREGQKSETEETQMDCSPDKSISKVSRKLFENETATENSGTPNEEFQMDCDSLIQHEEKNGEKSHDVGMVQENTTMETDTNDFELRFSNNDFDTNLNLKELELDCNETESATKSNNEKSEMKVDEEDKSSELVEEKKNDSDLGSQISKVHDVGLPPPDFDDEITKKKTLNRKIPAHFLNMKPTLHGSPGTTIELSEKATPNQTGLKKLVDRFVRHSNVHKNEDSCSDVTVIQTEVTPEGLKIVEQVLPYKISIKPEDSDMNKPGAKLQKLKEELQQKISSKRNEEWRQKEEASKALDEYLGEEDEYEDKDNLLPDEEEEFDDESAESEPEEDDVLIKETKKSKCAFADDEAEVSDDNDKNEDDENVEDEEEEIEENEEENDEEDEIENDNDEENSEEHPKKLRRITAAFEDDSNLSEPSDSEINVKEDRKKEFQRTKTDVDMFDDVSDTWASDIEDENHPKMMESVNPVSQTLPDSLSEKTLLSPITQLTALKMNLTSAKNNAASKERDSLDQMNDSLSQDSISTGTQAQSLNIDDLQGMKKKLFDKSPDAVNDDDLMDICSGNFNATTQENNIFKPLMNSSSQRKVTESQLLDLCSGSFASQPIDENSQDMKLTFDEESKSPLKNSPKKTVEVKSLSSRLKVVSSDEEDDDDKNEIKRKRKIAKLVLSDDEDEKKENLEFSDEEEEDEEEGENELERDEEKFVDYDSEENEVVVIPKKDIKKVAAKFVDAEAELSESDWDSADEDERDLDKLEREEGDDDEIDEDQMRNQIGKIHARQLLDDDQREVRLLQDMLFEDGDLHTEGAGRERKFKWKNIDSLGNDWVDSKTSQDPDAIVDALEDNNELELRKHRYEQQKFFDKQKKDAGDDIEEDLNDSQIFKFGLKIVKTIKTSLSADSALTEKVKKPLAPSIIPNLLENSLKTSTMQKPIRGSFLSRGEEALARIASIVDEKDKVIRAPLNGRRFVFEHISPSVKDVEEPEADKEASTSKTKTRKRTSTSDSTPKAIKKKKVDEGLSGKKLFN